MLSVTVAHPVILVGSDSRELALTKAICTIDLHAWNILLFWRSVDHMESWLRFVHWIKNYLRQKQPIETILQSRHLVGDGWQCYVAVLVVVVLVE